MHTFYPVLLGLVVLGLLEGLFYVFRFVRERKRAQLQRRLRSLGRGEPAGSILLRAGRLSSIGFVNDLLQPLQFARYLERLLEQADADITVAQLLAFSMVGGLLGALLGILGNMGLVLAILFGVLGFCLPFIILLLARSDRSRKVSEQLPEALEMMTRSLRAGHALETAFQLVASEAPTPVGIAPPEEKPCLVGATVDIVDIWTKTITHRVRGRTSPSQRAGGKGLFFP